MRTYALMFADIQLTAAMRHFGLITNNEFSVKMPVVHTPDEDDPEWDICWLADRQLAIREGRAVFDGCRDFRLIAYVIMRSDKSMEFIWIDHEVDRVHDGIARMLPQDYFTRYVGVRLAP